MTDQELRERAENLAREAITIRHAEGGPWPGSSGEYWVVEFCGLQHFGYPSPERAEEVVGAWRARLVSRFLLAFAHECDF